MSLIPYNEDYMLPAFGLTNSGAICYFNTMLQCFLSQTSVILTFENEKVHNKNPLCKSIWTLIKCARNKSACEAQSLIVNHTFKFQLAKKNISTSLGNGMEDAHEGFIKFLEALDVPEIEDLFEHRYLITIMCPCGAKHDVPDNNTNVFITVNKDETLLDTMLSKYSETDKDYKCDSCKKRGVNIRKDKYVFTPEIIIAHFAKYKCDKNKPEYNRFKADVPNKFTIPGTNGDINYKLTALSEHSGDLTGGHYWAKCLRKDGTCVLNDSSIISGDLIGTENTYMAWYHTY